MSIISKFYQGYFIIKAMLVCNYLNQTLKILNVSTETFKFQCHEIEKMKMKNINLIDIIFINTIF
jgi:hypothetical protein